MTDEEYEEDVLRFLETRGPVLRGVFWGNEQEAIDRLIERGEVKLTRRGTPALFGLSYIELA